VDHDELDGILLGLAEGQHSLELGTIGGLCRLAFVAKDFEDRPVVTGAEVNTPRLLSPKTQVLNLFFRGNATIDDGIHVARSRQTLGGEYRRAD
jgi:hypothetical protein